uniref:mitotic checkpoint serine/threonine-protein kinase BUB1-like n=1 Tax=Monopterus albus TaxID=43700 RepID=UPI0009B2E90D|nr:mitotic checkpoint serine/threonine-protein kinase BUB1-like [Monopterus albus]
MDIARYLQCFESSLNSYTGDDPLDPWDKFVELMEQRLPTDSGSGLAVVFDSLVKRFLNDDRYANDTRYVNYCIKCASYCSDPIVLYSHIYSKGIGTRAAALYVAWAQQYENRSMNEQADAVYHKAMENQAQPADTVLHEYRQFQTRTRSQMPGSGVQIPLQTSRLTNQMSSHREPAAQAITSVDCLSKPPTNKTILVVSRSETSGMLPPSQGSSVQTVSEYIKDELVCEGSEFCFEEVRAAKYFCNLQEKKENKEREMIEKRLRENEEKFLKMKSVLDKLNQDLETCGGITGHSSSQRLSVVETATSLNPNPIQQFFGQPRPSHRLSSSHPLGLRLHSEPTFTAIAELPQQQNHNWAADGNATSSDVSHHHSVLADRNIHLPKTYVSTDQLSVSAAHRL